MKKKIINPYIKEKPVEEYQCFGCSPNNKLGLKLQFSDCGSNEIEAFWKPEPHFEGFFKILHGGIQATLQDEIAGWLVFTKCKTSGVTQSLNVKYLKPVYVTDAKLRITAQLKHMEGKYAIINTRVYNSDGEICSEGELSYYIFPEAIAKRKHQYPGADAFYDKGDL